MGRTKYLRVSTAIGHALPKHETSNDTLEEKTLVNRLSVRVCSNFSGCAMWIDGMKLVIISHFMNDKISMIRQHLSSFKSHIYIIYINRPG